MAGWTKTSGVNGSANQTTLVLGAIAAGQFIRVNVRIGAIGATVSCADNQDGAYTLSKSQVDAADNTLYEFRLYPTVNTASRTVTITTSSGSCRIIASWFTPPTSTTSVALSTSNGATGSGTSVASGNATAANGDLVGGAASVTNSASVDWTAGGTSAGGTWATDQDFNDLAHNVYSQYVVASAGGTFASTPVYGGTDSIASLIVVYAATAAGGSNKPIAVDTINATSSMSAAVQRLRPIPGATINATSAMSTAVQRLRPIPGATINATSAVNATLSRIGNKPLTAAISATSAIAASLRALHVISGASITATSPISASVTIPGGATPVSSYDETPFFIVTH